MEIRKIINISAIVMFILLAVGPVGVFAATKPSKTLSRGIVSLTFDDGTRSILDNAIPILNAAHLKSTQYIITSFLDGRDPNYMTAAEVVRLQAEGHEIGSHTRTHPFLPSISAVEVINELLQSKQDLSDLGINATTFAYPLGGYNKDIVDAVKQAGYAGARTVDYGWDGHRCNLFRLKVQNIYPDTTVESVKAKISWTLGDHTWLILVFHNVRPEPSIDGTTTMVLQGIVDYLVKKKVRVVTVAEGLKLRSQLAVPPIR